MTTEKRGRFFGRFPIPVGDSHQRHEQTMNPLFNIMLATCLVATTAGAQTTFTRITDAGNPVVTDAPPPGYPGVSWVDYDNDGKLDLSITGPAPNYLYHNLGSGLFERVVTAIGATQAIQPGSGGGHSWADFDNDGDLDVCVTGAKTLLYRNDGNGVFTKVLSGPLADSIGNRGWACAWGDFDKDGDVDLIIAHPGGFFPPGSTPNVFLRNDGPPNYTFTKDDTSAVVSQGVHAYTVGSFVDYDLDGDLDVFIGTGPVNSTGGLDYMYTNMYTETGTAFFRRITTLPFATETADGQNCNWIDIDNDGDLDGYRSNYGANGPLALRKNNLYRNDGGTYVRVTTGAIVTDQLVSLANLWGDFDNDGDIDCFVTNEGGANNSLYFNNGDGTFTPSASGSLVTTLSTFRAASAGDYDGDGDLDLMVVGPSTTARGLYRNDLNNGNSWINIRCTGVQSDRAAIGTRVRAKATINGVAQWQLREISSQNSFNGANMINVHFGFGDATVIDSLEIVWNLGLKQTFTAVLPNRFYAIDEGGGLSSLTSVPTADRGRPTLFRLDQNYPNPFNPSTSVEFSVGATGTATLIVYDLLGRRVATLYDGIAQAGTAYRRKFDATGFASGMYVCRLNSGEFRKSIKLMLTR